MKQKTTMKADQLLMRDLENAAKHFEKRSYFLYRALHKYITFNELYAIAFIRFSPVFSQGSHFIYAGSESDSFNKWISSLLGETVEETLINLTNSTWISPFENGKIASYEEGIIISWPLANGVKNEEFEQLLISGLRAISYVEMKEHDYFYEIGTPFEPDIAQSIQEKDQDGLVELLSLTKSMTKSDITFWGEADSRQVEVDMHIGSRNSDFGFLLPLGEGIGGLAAAKQTVLQVPDYQNCAYRYENVSGTVDDEKIRTVFALPLKDNDSNTSGILYVGNRTVNPLPLHKKFLLLRLGNQLEPIVKRNEVKQFFTTMEKDNFFKQEKSSLREIGQSARSFTEVERWLAKLLQGDVLIIDAEGKPYQISETTKAKREVREAYSYPLTYNERNLGTLYIWTNIKLPLERHWPDLIDDVMHTIFIINERNERYYHLAELERSQWIYNMLQQANDRKAQYEKGVKLRVPVDEGEVWAFHLNKTSEFLSLEEKIALEEISLHYLRQPIYYNGTSGYIFFDRAAKCSAEHFRNKLLTVNAVETWLIHGATYRSFEELQIALSQVDTLLKNALYNQTSDYVLSFDQFGLDNLLSNPRVADELQSFAQNMLQTVIAYDEKNDSDLTKTLALSLIYKSPTKVAKKLFIHPNTVHYRVNRAKQLLKLDLDDVHQEIALTFASYTWLFEQGLINEA
ncbi:MAG TPA: helix-turn-helix domain-containing protein [Pseudogracilibacillus sp.]|nr:helix-turn-helix domain-containing protein [Pseudogracilibacillus sp.]